MNFQNLTSIEEPDAYLDIAFRAAKRRAEVARDKKAKDRLTKSKFIEVEKITTIQNKLKRSLNRIVTSYPSFDDLDEFYRKLIKIMLDYAQLKKSLGALSWCIKKINEFSMLTTKKIRASRDPTIVNKHRREYYGRVSSLLKQVKDDLRYLEAARKVMKDFPAIKTSCPTVCIAGFPNVGKSTLLSKLTPATPEINDYAFTTKKLNLGYWKYKTKKIQFIDTPGTLNRDKMNIIEKQADLALRLCADVVVYVFDLTEESVDLKKQKKLFLNLRKLEKPMLVYFSKTDILDKKVIDEFSMDGIQDVEILQKTILKELKNAEKKEEEK